MLTCGARCSRLKLAVAGKSLTPAWKIPKRWRPFAIKLTRAGMLEGAPMPEKAPDTPYLRSLQESGLRAIIACQPYKLPAAYFEEWKNFAPVFTSSFPLVSSLYLPLNSSP